MDLKHADITHPDEKSSSSSPDDNRSVRAEPGSFSGGQGQASEERQWWDEPKTPVRRNPAKDMSLFEFKMPEHLPNSPMCPANPKHKGKGKLICVVSALVLLLFPFCGQGELRHLH